MSGALSDREQMVLRFRYGFHDGQMHNVQDTAKRYGVTPARIDRNRSGRQLGRPVYRHGCQTTKRALRRISAQARNGYRPPL